MLFALTEVNICNMPRRRNDDNKKSSDGKVFGALGGSSQRSHRSLKEVFGDISNGTSKVLRSIRDQFASSDQEGSESSNTSRTSKASRKSSDKKQVDGGSKHSKKSKMDKSHMSKKRGGLRSGIVREGRSQAGHRGNDRNHKAKFSRSYPSERVTSHIGIQASVISPH